MQTDDVDKLVFRAAKHISNYCAVHSCPSCRFWMEGWNCMFHIGPARWSDMLEVLERRKKK